MFSTPPRLVTPLALLLLLALHGCSDSPADDGDPMTTPATPGNAGGEGTEADATEADAGIGSPVGDGEPVAGGPASDTPPPATQEDFDAPFFEADRVLEVRIELGDADWQMIRGQGRSLLEIFGGDDCQADPFGSPFTFVSGTVSVDGETLENVGVRKKGFFGSLSSDKPSLKLNFGEYEDAQTLSGMRRMTLNNNKQDDGHLNQCLGYQFFADAGVPAPRCNFARVFVNGDYLGVYTHVESVKKPFLRQHFGSDGGNLYEGTISDFRAGWDGTFEQKTNAMSDPDRADLQAVTDAIAGALVRGPGEPNALEALEPLIDVERFISFWAMESLIGHGDGYASNTNNFFVYADPEDGRFVFMPWGADQLFDNGEERSGNPLPAVLTQGVVASAIYGTSAGFDRYTRRLNELLDDFRTEDRLAEIARMEGLISPHIPSDHRESFDRSIGDLKFFIGKREQELRDLLPGALPPGASTPRESFCFEARGTVSGTFSTTWNSLDNPGVNPADFSATFTPTGTDFSYLPNPLGLTTAVAGIDKDADSPEFEATVLLISQQLDGSTLLVLLQTGQDDLGPGDLPIDFTENRGILVRQVEGEEGQVIGLLGEGSVTFDQAATTDGAPVTGSFSATVFDPGFLLGG